MKTIAIWDIHGRDVWHQILDQDYDLAIFMGDYFDTKDNISYEAQKENFKEILRLKKAHPEKYILLIGNHDYHYLPYVHERYSGFEAVQKFDIWELLDKPIKEWLLQIAYEMDGYLFTHAGVSTDFLNLHLVDAQDLNEAFLQSPDIFEFYRGDMSWYWTHPAQGPLWIRPATLALWKLWGYKHVVWHTQLKENTTIQEQDWIIQVDALHVWQYLIIEDWIWSIWFIS